MAVMWLMPRDSEKATACDCVRSPRTAMWRYFLLNQAKFSDSLFRRMGSSYISYGPTRKIGGSDTSTGCRSSAVPFRSSSRTLIRQSAFRPTADYSLMNDLFQPAVMPNLKSPTQTEPH